MDTKRTAPTEVQVLFSYDEALVLSDLLDRWSRSKDESGLAAAEVVLLNDFCASFEPVIDEVFSPDYPEVVEAARRRIAAADQPS